jgi:hypothetical protein
MKKFNFLLFSFFILQATFAQKICYLKINMNDCDKCYIGLNNKTYNGNDIKIKYVFQKMYFDERDDIINKFNIDTITETILFNDSLFRIFNKKYVSSSIHLFVSNTEYASFPMKAIDKNLYLLKSPDTITVKDLPKNFTCKLQNGRLYIFNRSKSEIIIRNLNEEVPKSFKFKITDKITKMCFNAYFRDTIPYNNFYDSLPLRNIPKFVRLTDILSFDVLNDTIFVLSDFLYDNYCIKNGIQDTCMFNFYSLLKVYGKSLDVTTVRQAGQGTLLSYDSKRLGIFGSKLNIEKEGNYYTNLIKKDFEFNETDRYMARLAKNDDYLEDDKTVKVKMPKLNYKYAVFYVSDYTMHHPYLFHSFSTELINLETNKKMELEINYGDLSYLNNLVPEFGNPTKLKFKIVDFVTSNDSIKVMFNRENKTYLQNFSLVTGKGNVEKLFLIFEDSSLLRTEPQFQDFNTIILFPQSEDYFVRVKN